MHHHELANRSTFIFWATSLGSEASHLKGILILDWMPTAQIVEAQVVTPRAMLLGQIEMLEADWRRHYVESHREK